jgi:hypothetical protein
MGKESLEVMARMTDTKINVQEVVSKWLLLTYDLPHNEEGDKARREFLLEAAAIGAIRHTDSVYLMPWTPEADRLALKLSRIKGGNTVVWTSQPTDPALAKPLTTNYDRSLEPQLKEIGERIDRIWEHQQRNRRLLALKLVPKTEKLLTNVEQAILRRGSAVLQLWVDVLRQRFQKVA